MRRKLFLTWKLLRLNK